MKNNIAGLLDSNVSEVVTEEMLIKENLLRFTDISIQLSNISYLFSGKKKFKIPIVMIIFILISLILLFTVPIVGVILTGISAFYVWTIYNNYTSSKQYLTLYLNSGQVYQIHFNSREFLEQVRDAVEFAFNNNNAYYDINIEKQTIENGDKYSITSKHANINSHNKNSFNDSSVNVKDTHGSTIQGAISGNDNKTSNTINKETSYNWKEIQAELKKVIEAIKIDSEVKKASLEALKAANQQNEKEFVAVVKNNKTVFLSELFQNIVSQSLAQVITYTMGIR
ncbi:hypothetical protein [Listeria goaensis]|uniref:hypothetical protein n=1 Tax=Listeria goaensis TaxID=1649188 RepID=UPI000B58D89C|nr:hypothetical protein [Listeria goaensis]